MEYLELPRFCHGFTKACARARLRLLRAPTEGCKYPAAISTADAQFVPADALALVGLQVRMHSRFTSVCYIHRRLAIASPPARLRWSARWCTWTVGLRIKDAWHNHLIHRRQAKSFQAASGLAGLIYCAPSKPHACRARTCSICCTAVAAVSGLC